VRAHAARHEVQWWAKSFPTIQEQEPRRARSPRAVKAAGKTRQLDSRRNSSNRPLPSSSKQRLARRVLRA
jgi:hypothetical protein